jgi:hypothetical protein
LKLQSLLVRAFFGFWSGDFSFGRLNDSIEAIWVSYSNFTQHFTVQLNVGFFAAVDELAVPYAPLPTGSAEACNPQSSEISFAAFAVDTGIDGCPNGSFFSEAINVTCWPATPLYCFEDSFLGLVSCRAFSDSWHISFPLRIFDFFGLLAAADSKPRSKPVISKTPSYYFSIYLRSWFLTVLAVVPVIIAELPIRLRRLALLPLIR